MIDHQAQILASLAIGIWLLLTGAKLWQDRRRWWSSSFLPATIVILVMLVLVWVP